MTRRSAHGLPFPSPYEPASRPTVGHAGQRLGVSVLSPVMVALRDMQLYRESIHTRAAAEAALMAFVTTQEDQDADPRSVRIRKDDLTVWRREIDHRGNSLTFSVRRNSTEKSILLEGYVGLRYLPGELEMAILSMCCEMAELEGMPKDIQQSSFEGVSRSRLTGDERKQQLLSHDRVLLSWKAQG